MALSQMPAHLVSRRLALYRKQSTFSSPLTRLPQRFAITILDGFRASGLGSPGFLQTCCAIWKWLVPSCLWAPVFDEEGRRCISPGRQLQILGSIKDPKPWSLAQSWELRRGISPHSFGALRSAGVRAAFLQGLFLC